MLSKKALFLITAENEVEALVEFAKVFKKKYGIEAEGLYVKDILKYEIFPIAVEESELMWGQTTHLRNTKN